MSRPPILIKDLVKGNQVWKMLIRNVNLWVVKEKNGLQHLEMVIQDSKVTDCLSVCIYLWIRLLNEHRNCRVIKFTWLLAIESLKIGLNNLLNMKHIVYTMESLWLMTTLSKYAQTSWNLCSMEEPLIPKWKYLKYYHTNIFWIQLHEYIVTFTIFLRLYMT